MTGALVRSPRRVRAGRRHGGALTARPPRPALRPAGPEGARRRSAQREGQVNLVAWAGYAEDGINDPKVDWVTAFEKETGCQVNVKIGNTSDEMVSLMKTGQYDAVSASGDASLRLIAAGDVAPVNTDLVPNYKDVFDGLKNQPWNSVDGVAYGIPHGRGANLLMCGPTRSSAGSRLLVGACSTRRSPYKGKITAYDSPIYIADAALYLMATKPELGIKNPYALDEKQFHAAVDLLKQQNAHIGEYWSDYPRRSRPSRAATPWSAPPGRSSSTSPRPTRRRSRRSLPKEGATGWSDTWMVAAKAKHPNCAYKWMDHIISPEANAQVAEWFGEAPANEQGVRPDRGQEPLRDLPRRRRGLLRQGLVLDHADHRSASTAAPTSSARTTPSGRRPGRRSRADVAVGRRQRGSTGTPSRIASGGCARQLLHRHPLAAAGPAAVRADALAGGGLSRRRWR